MPLTRCCSRPNEQRGTYAHFTTSDAERSVKEVGDTHSIKDPCDVFVCDHEDAFASPAQLVKER